MVKAVTKKRDKKRQTLKLKSKAKPSSTSRSLDVRSAADVSKLVDLIKGNSITLVLIYADWCGHCKTFKEDIWSKLKTMPDRKVPLAEVNADILQNTPLASAKIDGYPSVVPIGNDMKMATLKDESGQPTNALPNTRDMSTMQTIVRSDPDEVLSNVSTVVQTSLEEPSSSDYEDSTESLDMPSSLPGLTEPPRSEEDIIMSDSLPAQYEDVIKSVLTPESSASKAQGLVGGYLYRSLKGTTKRGGGRRRRKSHRRRS